MNTLEINTIRANKTRNKLYVVEKTQHDLLYGENTQTWEAAK